MTQQLTEVARSRFKLLERPFAHPGKCAVCGATSRPVIDFDLDLEDYGVVYFCVQCLTQVAHDNLDMVMGSELRAIQLIVEELDNKLNFSAEVTNEYVTNISRLSSAYIYNISHPASEVSDETNGQSENVHESDDRSTVGTESTSDGSIIDERPPSVSASSSDGTKSASPFNFS